MRVLQINWADLIGQRFNGLSIKEGLAAKGVESRYLVWQRDSNLPEVSKFCDFRVGRVLTAYINRLENRLSIQSLLTPFPFAIPFNREFRAADLVHLHIIHNGYFNILALPLLTRLKPTIWTLHDPWALTGHCIYPFDCERWKIGCGECPYLDSHMALRADRTHMLAKMKEYIYRASRLDIVVASRWMFNMVEKSPLLKRARLHHIPFGINLEWFRPGDAAAARKKLGIPADSIVLCFRSTPSPFKGLSYIVEALKAISTTRKICLLTTEHKGYLNNFVGKIQTVEMGWINDDQTMLDIYTAADIFLMPSTAEAFGMMAIEAMACGKPIICFDGTSLPEITFAPDAGIAVPFRNGAALRAAIEKLVNDPAERERRGRISRELAVRHYDERLYVERLTALYQRVDHDRQHH